MLDRSAIPNPMPGFRPSSKVRREHESVPKNAADVSYLRNLRVNLKDFKQSEEKNNKLLNVQGSFGNIKKYVSEIKPMVKRNWRMMLMLGMVSSISLLSLQCPETVSARRRLPGKNRNSNPAQPGSGGGSSAGGAGGIQIHSQSPQTPAIPADVTGQQQGAHLGLITPVQTKPRQQHPKPPRTAGTPTSQATRAGGAGSPRQPVNGKGQKPGGGSPAGTATTNPASTHTPNTLHTVPNSAPNTTPQSQPRQPAPQGLGPVNTSRQGQSPATVPTSPVNVTAPQPNPNNPPLQGQPSHSTLQLPGARTGSATSQRSFNVKDYKMIRKLYPHDNGEDFIKKFEKLKKKIGKCEDALNCGFACSGCCGNARMELEDLVRKAQDDWMEKQGKTAQDYSKYGLKQDRGNNCGCCKWKAPLWLMKFGPAVGSAAIIGGVSGLVASLPTAIDEKGERTGNLWDDDLFTEPEVLKTRIDTDKVSGMTTLDGEKFEGFEDYFSSDHWARVDAWIGMVSVVSVLISFIGWIYVCWKCASKKGFQALIQDTVNDAVHNAVTGVNPSNNITGSQVAQVAAATPVTAVTLAAASPAGAGVTPILVPATQTTPSTGQQTASLHQSI